MAGWTDAANAGGNGGKGGDVILVSSAAVWDFSNLQHHLVKPCPCVIVLLLLIHSFFLMVCSRSKES